MEFLKHLQIETELEMESLNLWDDLPNGFRICNWLEINDSLSLSIQASSNHYCIPRAFVPLHEYTHFELAIIFNGELSKDISHIKDFSQLEELKECQSGTVFSYVDKNIINNLYLELIGMKE